MHARFSDWHIKVSLSGAQHCLPSHRTNLAPSEGSSLIHASENALNQPLIKREHAEVSRNIPAAPVSPRSRSKHKEMGCFCPPLLSVSPVHYSLATSKCRANI